jgi:hypothetical protein
MYATRRAPPVKAISMFRQPELSSSGPEKIFIVPATSSYSCTAAAMKRILALILFFALNGVANPATVLISEIAPATSSGDWVELMLVGGAGECMEISHLLVTMYYGSNERLCAGPVTLYAQDRPETPWDDRFAVAHLTDALTPDECDRTGDTNGNGVLDLYCDNYSSSLWNTDCVVAIDSDDEPGNGGILDFAAFSNRDGSVNATIGSYVQAAQAAAQWAPFAGPNIQECMIDISPDGLLEHQSIARLPRSDSGTLNDFAVTSFQTPGRPNLFSADFADRGNLFIVRTGVIAIGPGQISRGQCDIPLLLLEPCDIKLRVFSVIGMQVFSSPLHRSLAPGLFTLQWSFTPSSRQPLTGLYIAHIEATGSSPRRSQRERVMIVAGRR